MRRNNRWPGAVRKTRCDYCNADPVVWLWYTTRLAYRGPYRQSGTVAMNNASCAEHEGCVNWSSNVALHPEGRVERALPKGAK